MQARAGLEMSLNSVLGLPCAPGMFASHKEIANTLIWSATDVRQVDEVLRDGALVPATKRVCVAPSVPASATACVYAACGFVNANLAERGRRHVAARAPAVLDPAVYFRFNPEGDKWSECAHAIVAQPCERASG